MRTDAFDYDLPEALIAQTPVEPRDSARLLVVHRATGALEHRVFRDIGAYLRPGDRLVVNDSRVMPARLRGRKTTGGAVEVLLLRPERGLGRSGRETEGSGGAARAWTCLVGGRVRVGSRIVFGAVGEGAGASDAPAVGPALSAEVVALGDDGTRTLAFDRPPGPHLDRLGTVPLPPYIRAELPDPERYQTVYAAPVGSAAAPTAGLHFTPSLIAALRAGGIDWSTVTLHVGLDTFRPVEAETVADHRIHREWAVVDPPAAGAINATRAAGGRIVAVGTTSVRVLETAARSATARQAVRATGAGGARDADTDADEPPVVAAFEGWTDLFVTPGFRFRAVDALVTNFHLPRSTLLMLVAAFAGKPLIDHAYATAVAERYRFYSFGDAMLIL